MKLKKALLVGGVLLFSFFCFTSSHAQGYMGYMLTKTLLDSVKVNKLHGTAGLSLKVEQTDAIKFELDVATELVYSLDKHRFRFSGNVAYNFLNDTDTGNKGFFHLQGDFFQYRIEGNKREKAPFFFSAAVTYNYDYLRDLHNRATVAMNFTFQPLREHPHLCLEPGIGIAGVYQHWDAINARANKLGVERSALLESYNALPDISREYLRISDKGHYNQWNFKFNAFVNFWGESIPQEAISCCDDVREVFSALGIDPAVDYDLSLYYAFDKATLDAKAKKNIEKVVEKLKADADLKVELRGYCDFPGSNDYNLKLSERRINAVKDALVKAGIEESRITTTPQGKLPNPPKAEQKNRRCDFFFSK